MTLYGIQYALAGIQGIGDANKLSSMDHLYKAGAQTGAKCASSGAKAAVKAAARSHAVHSSPQRNPLFARGSFAFRQTASPQGKRSLFSPNVATPVAVTPRPASRLVDSPGSVSPPGALDFQQETAMMDGRSQRLRENLVAAIKTMDCDLVAITFEENLTTNGCKKVKAQLLDLALPIGLAMHIMHAHIILYDTYICIYIYICTFYIHMISHAISVMSIQILGCTTFRYDCVCVPASLCCVFVCVWLCRAQGIQCILIIIV